MEEMTWPEVLAELESEGLEPWFPDLIDESIISSLSCDGCGRANYEALAFRGNRRRYVLYAVCPKCGYFVEV